MSERTERARQPLLGHLTELRNRLIKAVVAVAAGAVVAFIFREWIFDLLEGPYLLVTDRPLVITGPTELFSIAMRIALFGGVMLASPVLAYQAWAFINPGLTPRERKWAFPVAGALTLLFCLGVAFAYWSLERALGFLLVGIMSGPEVLVTVDAYTRFAVRFLLLFGVSFQYPVFLFGAAAAGMVTSAKLGRARRWAVLIIVTVGALVTPTGDPLTLLLLSTPLYLFYEATIWLIRLVLKK